MEKYELLAQQIRHEGLVEKDRFFIPQAVREEDILFTHCNDYWERLKHLEITDKEMKKVGFPLSRELVDRELDITGGTVQLAEWALDNGCGLNIAGGTHHAFTNRGEGYCLLNDQAVAIRSLQNRGLIKKALLVDLDVHQGNGTAQIFRDDESVFTFSMHGQGNYPTRKEQSDLDIALADGTGDEQYLSNLNGVLPKLITQHEPDMIFFQAGVDPLEGDRFGRLALSMNGLAERDEMVIKICADREIPLVITMGGGYSKSIAKIINAHTQTFRLAAKYFD